MNLETADQQKWWQGEQGKLKTTEAVHCAMNSKPKQAFSGERSSTTYVSL